MPKAQYIQDFRHSSLFYCIHRDNVFDRFEPRLSLSRSLVLQGIFCFFRIQRKNCVQLCIKYVFYEFLVKLIIYKYKRRV